MEEMQNAALHVSNQPQWGQHSSGCGSVVAVGSRAPITTLKCSLFTAVRVVGALGWAKHASFLQSNAPGLGGGGSQMELCKHYLRTELQRRQKCSH